MLVIKENDCALGRHDLRLASHGDIRTRDVGLVSTKEAGATADSNVKYYRQVGELAEPELHISMRI